MAGEPVKDGPSTERALPKRIALCPVHAEEFYYPLNEGESARCPSCSLEMVVYERNEPMLKTDNHPTERELLALGWVSSELAARADAWNGQAPFWFPEPPEWMTLWEAGLSATEDARTATQSLFEAAIAAGERSHLLTVGSPVRGLCLRVSLGRLDRHGCFHGRQPDVFLIWRGRRI